MNALAITSLLCTLGLGGISAPINSISANQVVTSTTAIDESSGHIGEVEVEKLTFTLITDTEKLTFMVNEKTAYTLNGEKAEMKAALLENAAARVVHADGVAFEVHVTTEG